MPQLLAFDPLLVGVISSVPPLSHGPKSMIFPGTARIFHFARWEPGLLASLGRFICPGQTLQCWNATVMRSWIQEQTIENGLVLATEQHLNREHGQGRREDAEVRKSWQDGEQPLNTAQMYSAEIHWYQQQPGMLQSSVNLLWHKWGIYIIDTVIPAS